MVRRFTITAVVAAILLAVTGCLTPLTSQPPQPTPPKQLAPVPTPASPLVGVLLATGFLALSVAGTAVLALRSAAASLRQLMYNVNLNALPAEHQKGW